MKAKYNTSDKRKCLLDLCKTQSTVRQKAYNHFYQAYVPLVETFEVISQGLHLEKYEKIRCMYADWDSKSKTDACSLLHAITDFTFLVTFMLVYKFLSHMQGVTVLLQKTSLDILEAYSLVSGTCIILYVCICCVYISQIDCRKETF